MADFALLREQMVKRQIEARGIHDADILRAFLDVPREQFISADFAGQAYADGPLPIEAGQTISQPYIVALMIQAAEIARGDKVLEVGAGSGYAAAVISRIAAKVVAIERQPELVTVARERLARLGFDNVEIVEGDGTRGWPDVAPYDAILVAAGAGHIPEPLVEQLAPGGCLVMPVGGVHAVQELIKLSKNADDGTLSYSSLGGVRFVPLIGAEA